MCAYLSLSLSHTHTHTQRKNTLLQDLTIGLLVKALPVSYEELNSYKASPGGPISSQLNPDTPPHSTTPSIQIGSATQLQYNTHSPSY